jgi:hypothetical protein
MSAADGGTARPRCAECGELARFQVEGETDRHQQAVFVCGKKRCWGKWSLFPPRGWPGIEAGAEWSQGWKR